MWTRGGVRRKLSLFLSTAPERHHKCTTEWLPPYLLDPIFKCFSPQLRKHSMRSVRTHAGFRALQTWLSQQNFRRIRPGPTLPQNITQKDQTSHYIFFTLVSVSVGGKDLKSAREAPESLGVKLTGTDGEKERKQQFWFCLGLLLQSWKKRGREAPDLTCDERSEV